MPPHAVDSSLPSVAFLIDRWEPDRGGAERAMADFAEFLARRGHRVLAVAERHERGGPGEPVAVSSFGLTRSQRERDRARKLVAAAREHGADVKIGCRHLYECDLFWPHGGAHRVTLEQRALAEGANPRAEPSGRHRTFIDMERELCERGGARKIACVSEMVQRELALEWPNCVERLALAPNGVDLGRFRVESRTSAGARLREDLGIAASETLAVFAARNPVLKGAGALSKAWELLRTKRPDFRLLVAGLREREARAHDLAGSQTLFVREFVEPLTLWSAADLCVLPTWRDPCPLSVLEALACGTPVITTRFAGVAELVRASGGVVLDSPADIDGLAEALRGVRNTLTEAERQAIRSSVAGRSIERCHETLAGLVAELASSRGGAR